MASKFTIIQEGIEEIKYQFYIERLGLHVPAEGGTYSLGDGEGTLGRFSIISYKNSTDIDYTLLSNDSFIEVNNTTKMVTIKPNDTESDRSGYFECKQNESGDYITFVVNQKGIEVKPEPYFIVAGSNGYISKLEI